MGTEFKEFRPVYTGEWKKGKRCGKGEEMGETGNVVKKGEWFNGVHEGECSNLVPQSLTSNPFGVEELKIGRNAYNDANIIELKLKDLPHLKRLEIGDWR